MAALAQTNTADGVRASINLSGTPLERVAAIGYRVAMPEGDSVGRRPSGGGSVPNQLSLTLPWGALQNPGELYPC